MAILHRKQGFLCDKMKRVINNGKSVIDNHSIIRNIPIYNIGLIHVFDVVNIRRRPKNGLTPEGEARGC